jgi:hypothetical protein
LGHFLARFSEVVVAVLSHLSRASSKHPARIGGRTVQSAGSSSELGERT